MENHFNGLNYLPANEPERLAALEQYGIFGTPPEGAFNHIAEMAARMFDVPIALVNFVGEAEVWTKAGVGLPHDSRVPRGTSLCSLAILNRDPTIFNDALTEPCLLANPLVTGDLGLRFYAAAPIINDAGIQLGAVCLVDSQPRSFSRGEQKVLEGLAQIVLDELESRYGQSKPR